MKGRAIIYSAEELAWIKAMADEPRRETHALFVQAFNRPDVSLSNLSSLCKRNGWLTGRTGQFVKGEKRADNPSRKGHHPPGCEKGWFRKGNIPHTARGIGHESIDPKDGYVWIIVGETNPQTGAPTRRVMKHRWLWEKANGPVPEGYALKCLDGDRSNCDPSNWEAVKRGVLPRLNGGRHKKRMAYDEAPDELKPTVMAIAKVQQAVHELRKRGQA